MIRHTTLRYPAFSLLAMGLLICAGVKQRSEKSVFQRLDEDEDGRIARKELPPGVKKVTFESMDKNRDNAIDRKEWSEADDSAEAESRFAAIDKNRDRKISFKEEPEKKISL